MEAYKITRREEGGGGALGGSKNWNNMCQKPFPKSLKSETLQCLCSVLELHGKV